MCIYSMNKFNEGWFFIINNIFGYNKLAQETTKNNTHAKVFRLPPSSFRHMKYHYFKTKKL